MCYCSSNNKRKKKIEFGFMCSCAWKVLQVKGFYVDETLAIIMVMKEIKQTIAFVMVINNHMIVSHHQKWENNEKKWQYNKNSKG